MQAKDLKPGDVLVAKDGWRYKVTGLSVRFCAENDDKPGTVIPSEDSVSLVQHWIDSGQVTVERKEQK